MANVRWLWRNAAEAATLTASTEAADYPAENVQLPHLVQTWRTGGTQAAETLVIDLGAAVDVTAFALLGHDLDDTETALKIQGNASDSWGAPSVDVDLTYNATAITEFWSSQQSYRYWRLVVTKANAADVRNFGWLFIGQYYETPLNPLADSLRWGKRDPSEVRTTPGGQHHADRAKVLDTFAAQWKHVPEAMRTEVQAMADTLGTTRPLYLVQDAAATDPADEAIYGRLQRLAEVEGWFGSSGLREIALEVVQWR